MSGRVAYLSGAVFTVESILEFQAETVETENVDSTLPVKNKDYTQSKDDQ